MTFLPAPRMPEPCPPPGVYRDIDFDTYASWDALNSSTVSKFFVSGQIGKHYLNQTQDDDPPTADMLYGTAFHAAYLEPKRYAQTAHTPLVVPRATKDNPEPEPRPELADKCHWPTHKAAQDEHPGKLILHAGWAERIEAMRGAIDGHPVASALFNRIEGSNELTMIWHIKIKIGGETVVVPCKARIDRHVPSFTPFKGSPRRSAIVDIKTARDTDPHKFERSIVDYGYHRQAAWYLRGAMEHGLISKDLHDHSYIIVACEKKPPYPVATYPIIPAAIYQGLHECLTGLRAYVKYRMHGHAPGANQSLVPIGIPVYAMNSENEETQDE